MASQRSGPTAGRAHRVIFVQKDEKEEAPGAKAERVAVEEDAEGRATFSSDIEGSALLASQMDAALIASPVFPGTGGGRESEGLARERNARNASYSLTKDAEQGEKERRWPVQKEEAVTRMAQTSPWPVMRAK